MPGCCPLLMWCALCVCVCRTSRFPCCSPCPSLCRSAPHHRTSTLTMMMTCRLLCALLVLALCCCPSVCAAGSEDEKDRPEEDSDSTNFNPEVTNQVTQLLSTTSISSPEIHNEGRGTEDSQKMGILASYTTGTIEETPQSQNTSNITQDQDDGESNERTEHTNTVTANGQKKAAAPTTTTSTTQAPTTSNTQAPNHDDDHP
ncbi:mucin TcMUCII, partial [Trypanosoma cruzi]